MKQINFKDWVKPGQKCWCDFAHTFSHWWEAPEEKLVTIGEYKPYCTDGYAPTPDQYDDNTMVECNYEENIGNNLTGPKYVTYDDQFALGDLQPIRKISDCEENDLRYLFKQVTWGSMYYDDYRNELYVDSHELMDLCEGYSDQVAEEYPNDWYDHLVEDDFVEYCKDYICNMQYC